MHIHEQIIHTHASLSATSLLSDHHKITGMTDAVPLTMIKMVSLVNNMIAVTTVAHRQMPVQ
jgi:hypothetical protein